MLLVNGDHGILTLILVLVLWSDKPGLWVGGEVRHSIDIKKLFPVEMIELSEASTIKYNSIECTTML